MKIIHEIKINGSDAVRLFLSDAEPRKNNLRIHYHSLIEISVIVSGIGSYKTKNGVCEIKGGDVFFFRPNEAHCITDVEKEGMLLLNLQIAPSYLYSNFQNALNTNFIKILAASFPLKSNKINDTLPPEQIKEITELMLSIKKEYEKKESDLLRRVAFLVAVRRGQNRPTTAQLPGGRGFSRSSSTARTWGNVATTI